MSQTLVSIIQVRSGFFRFLFTRREREREFVSFLSILLLISINRNVNNNKNNKLNIKMQYKQCFIMGNK
jgi:hypothetical protein